MSDVIGVAGLARRLKLVSQKARERLFAINRKSGEELAQKARILVPKGKTLKALASIEGREPEAGVYQVDWGPLARILEGGREAGASDKGHPYPAMDPRPFVGPSRRLVLPKRRRALQKALRDAIRESGNA